MTTTSPHRSRVATLVDRYPAASYFALTLALSWGYWLPVLSADLPIPTLIAVVPGAFGPLAAAAVVTRLRGESVRRWLAEAVTWRRPLRWYALAVAVPAGISAVLLAILVGVTGGFDPSAVPRAATLFGVNVVFASLVGGGQEEFGWRGFALPHLQTRFDALTASLVIGAVWALWHAPMFAFGVYSENPALYAVGVLAYAVVFTWYYNSSRGCLVGAILMHGTLNAAVNVPPSVVEEVAALPVPYEGFLAVAFWVVALALIARYGRATLASGATVLPTWTGDDREEDGSTAPTVATSDVGD